MANKPPIDSQALAQLHDIHLPTSVGWWPLAPGWYVVAVLILVTFIAVIFLLRRHYLMGRARRQALQLLAMYQQQYQDDANHPLFAARLSELLKRIALVYFPRQQVAGLQGDEWIAFLNATAKGLDFNCVRHDLLETPYQPIMKGDLQPLFTIARQWISQRRGPCLN